MLRQLERLLAEREVAFDAQQSRIMCFPHIINIAVQHMLSKMSSAAVPTGDDDIEDMMANAINTNPARQRGAEQDYESAYKQDPVAHLRKIVVAICALGQRLDAFATWIKTGNDNNWFTYNNKIIRVPHKELLRDVRTCWDSTYQMIRRGIELRPVSLPSLNGKYIFD